MEFRDQLHLYELEMSRRFKKSETGEWLFVMFAQDHVFGNGKIPDHAIAHSFFGDIGKHSVGQIAGSKAW